MSPGLGPRSSQWSALQPWSVNLPLSCLISPVWVSPGYLTPVVATADPLSLVRAPGPGLLWWQPGAVQEEGSQWVRLPRAPGAWRVRHYWNTKWMLGCQHGQQTSNTVPSHLSKLSIIRSPGASPLLSLNKDPEALSTWALGSVQCLRHREGPSNIPSIIPTHCSSVIIIRVGDRSTQILQKPTNRTLNNKYWVRPETQISGAVSQSLSNANLPGKILIFPLQFGSDL